MEDEQFVSELTDDQEASSTPRRTMQPGVFYSELRDRQPRPQYPEAANLLEMAGAAIDNDFVTLTIHRDVQMLMDVEHDEDWNPNENEQVIRDLFEENGLEMRTGWVRRVRNSVSREHANRILQRVNTELENEQLIDNWFGGNDTGAFLSRLGLSLFDPAGWVAGGIASGTARTGLMSVARANVAQGARMAAEVSQAAGMARAAQATTGRGTWALRNGVSAAALDGSLEAYHLQRSPTSDIDEAGIAALGSLALGGAFSALGYKGAQRQMIARAVQDFEGRVQARFRQEVGDAAAADAAGNSWRPFTGDSVGAARLDLDPEDVPDGQSEFSDLIDNFDPGQNTAFGDMTRLDAYAEYGRSQNPAVRALGAIMLEDGAFSESTRGRPQHHSVELISMQHERVFSYKVGKEVAGAYDDWKKRNNIRTSDSAFDRKHYDDFIHKVARAVRGDPDVVVTPEIARARDAFRASMREQLAKAQKLGILEDVEPNDLYVPRFWRRDAFLDIIDEVGHPTKGRDVLTTLIARSLTDTDPEVASEIAEHVVDTIIDKGTNPQRLAEFTNMTRARLREAIQDRLPEGTSDEVLNAVSDILSGRGDSGRAPDGPRGEKRLRMDENTSMIIGGRKLRLDDLLNNDLLSINTIYSRQIGGRVGFAEVTGGKLKTTDDIEKFIAKAERGLQYVKDKDLHRETVRLENLKHYADYLLGHGSIAREGNIPEEAQAFMKFLRDVSFARLMGQVGYAQLSEIGTAVGALGFKAFMSNAPRAIKAVMNNYKPGMSATQDEIIRVLADNVALGNMHVQSRMRTLSRELDSEDTYGARDTTPGDRGPNMGGGSGRRGRLRAFAGKLGRGAELAARGTSILSGLQPITDFAQLATANTMLSQMARRASKGEPLIKKPRRMGNDEFNHRALALGFDEAWTERITNALNEAAEFDARGNLKSFDPSRSSDQDAIDHMFRGLLRESRRIVQEGDLGTSNMLLANPLVRLFMQFKTFVVNAHVKQMLNGMNMRDAQVMSEFLMSAVFAGIGQMAKYNLMTLGMGPENRQDYLEYAFGEPGADRVTKIMMSALRYTSHVGLLPDAIDTIAKHALGERLFDYRNTGLSSGFFDLESSAAANTLAAPLQPFNELAAGDPDDAVRDAMRIGPNFTPLVILGNVLQEAVPEDMPQRNEPLQDDQE